MGSDLAAVIIALLAVVILMALAIRGRFTRMTIFEYQRGMRYRDGRFVGLLDPGRHWIYRPSTVVHAIDMRETLLPLQGQELVTADGVSIKISLAARYRVSDPVRAINSVANYTAVLYSVVQIALRGIVGSRGIDEVLQHRDAVGTDTLARAAGPAKELGVELLTVDAKDIMFTGPMKRVFAQVVEARQQGLAALEKARGETAALRNLANAARLVEERPALMQLRLLQQVAGSSGNTVILGMPPASTPVPVRTDQAPEQPRLPPPSEEQ